MKYIVIVDDDVQFIELLKKRLEICGYRVHHALDGLSGLKAMREEKPDLAIIDVIMPRLDGFSLVCEMKTDASCKDIPIMIVTGKGDMEDIFRMEGIDVVLQKPFKMEDILKKIQGLIG